MSGGGTRLDAWRKSCSSASKGVRQRPQRTQPEETRSWSLTTRNAVPQAGQRVASVMRGMMPRELLPAGGAGPFAQPAGRVAVIRIQPSSWSVTSRATQGA